MHHGLKNIALIRKNCRCLFECVFVPALLELNHNASEQTDRPTKLIAIRFTVSNRIQSNPNVSKKKERKLILRKTLIRSEIRFTMSFNNYLIHFQYNSKEPTLSLKISPTRHRSCLLPTCHCYRNVIGLPQIAILLHEKSTHYANLVWFQTIDPVTIWMINLSSRFYCIRKRSL